MGKESSTTEQIIGQKWRELSEEEKQPFNDEYEADKARYNEQLKVYWNSVAFRRWQKAKQPGQQTMVF